MREPFLAGASLTLAAAFLAQSCGQSSSTALPKPFSLPAQVGGMAPVEGSDLLDPAFASNGVVDLLGFSERQPLRVAADRFSRVLIAGIDSFSPPVRVVRLTEAGTADTTFGQDAVAQVGSGAISAPRGPAISIDPLDRILLAYTRELQSGERRAVVTRLLPDGALDTDFGARGEVVLEPSAGATEVLASCLLADPLGGLFAGLTEIGPAGSRMAVARLDEAGKLDPAFGQAGIAHGSETEESLATCMTQDFAGRLTLAGALRSEPSRLAVWRFEIDGLPDLGFGADGLVTLADSPAVADRGVDVATDGLGRTVVLGERSHDLSEIDDWPFSIVVFRHVKQPLFDAVVWRFLVDGSPDQRFGDGGERVLAFNSGRYVSVSGGYRGGDHLEAATGLFLDQQDRIVVAGWSDPGLWDTILGVVTFGPTRPFLARLTQEGMLDFSFHDDGQVQIGWDNAGGSTSALARASGRLTALTQDPRGRWILAGGSNTSDRVWRVVP